MITIKLFNVIHQDRKNQNTTFTFWENNFKFTEEVTEEELMEVIEKIKPADVQIQKNTSLKIIDRRK